VFWIWYGSSLVQDLIDQAQRILVENRNLVQRMQPSLGIFSTGEDDAAFTNFKQVIVKMCLFVLIGFLSWSPQFKWINQWTYVGESEEIGVYLF